jgi:hypothetical protein
MVQVGAGSEPLAPDGPPAGPSRARPRRPDTPFADAGP